MSRQKIENPAKEGTQTNYAELDFDLSEYGKLFKDVKNLDKVLWSLQIFIMRIYKI